jgi:DNA modification methylase
MGNLSNIILHGDALAMLKTLPDRYVQCVVTSPPYYGLRDYGVSEQIGLEETPQAYIEKLVSVFREVRRVLKDDGVLWLNIGDSYASQAGPQVDQSHTSRTGAQNGAWSGKSRRVPIGLKNKDLMMIPARVAIALQEDGWWLRSDCIWYKPTAMPESVLDRPTTAHEHIFLLAKNEHYHYDADSIREPHVTESNIRDRAKEGVWASGALLTPIGKGMREWNSPQGRNKRTVWTVAAQPYPEAHFATMPPKLVEPCILAGSRAGDIVLDPFMGAGTVALVALQYQRQYLGIELNADYIQLANERIAVVQPRLWTAESEVVA